MDGTVWAGLGVLLTNIVCWTLLLVQASPRDRTKQNQNLGVHNRVISEIHQKGIRNHGE